MSGLITERMVWICASSTSRTRAWSTLPSRSRKIAPGWPLTSCGSNVTSTRAISGKKAGQQPGHLFGPDDSPRQLRGLATTVADHRHVRGKQILQAGDVAVAEGIEEPRTPAPAAPVTVRFEPRPPGLHVPPRPYQQLPACRLRTPHRRRRSRRTRSRTPPAARTPTAPTGSAAPAAAAPPSTPSRPTPPSAAGS